MDNSEHKSKLKTCFKDNRSNIFRDYDPEERLEIFTGIFSDLVIKLVNDNKLEAQAQKTEKAEQKKLERLISGLENK